MKRDVQPGVKAWANEGRFAHTLCEIVSVNNGKALIRSAKGGLDWVDALSLDLEVEIE